MIDRVKSKEDFIRYVEKTTDGDIYQKYDELICFMQATLDILSKNFGLYETKKISAQTFVKEMYTIAYSQKQLFKAHYNSRVEEYERNRSGN